MRRLLALGVFAALVLGGCGGEGESDTASVSRTAETTRATAPQSRDQSAAPKQQGKEREGSATNRAEKDPNPSKQSPATVKVPPISSAPIEGSEEPAPGVKTVKGGDNSVQTYGEEESDEARTEAAIALQAFLNERLQGDWEGVCAALASNARAQLDEFVKQLKDQGKDVGCAGAMMVLDKGTAQSQLRQEATITEVLSFRGGGHVPGDPSYLIFIGPPESTLYSMPMYLEAGAWKVGLALPAQLPV